MKDMEGSLHPIVDWKWSEEKGEAEEDDGEEKAFLGHSSLKIFCIVCFLTFILLYYSDLFEIIF